MKFLTVFTLVVISTLAEEPSLLKKFADGNKSCIGNLYQELRKVNKENFLICPLSIQTVFALVNSGAKGNTSQQIATTLHLPEGDENIKEVFTQLTKALQVNDQYTLSSANKIYLDNSFNIKEQYKSTAVNVFQADVQKIDFNQSEKAANEINAWVEEKTLKKIQNLISKDSLGTDTLAVLINALYFQGTWVTTFEDAHKSTFHINNEESELTNMMHVYALINYYHSSDLNASFIELPYKGEQVSMTIVLPDQIGGLASLEDRIADVLKTPEYSQTITNVTIPKFKIESTTHLVPILKNMGITDAFQGTADFSGIGENKESLVISQVVQKAFIEVNEKGTTASAATALIMERSGRQYDEVNFLANHPFLFYLKHKVNGIFFVGRLTKPQKAV